MKNIMKLMLLVGVLGFTACEDPDGLDNWFDKPEADRNMVLTLPAEELILTEDAAAEELTFSWNTINPPTDEYTIRYVFKIGVQGQNFTPALSSGDLTSDVTSYTISKRALNRFIIQDCAMAPNVEFMLEVKVLAYIENGPFYYKPTIAESFVKTVAYDIPLQHLYLVGDANPAGSGIENAMEITNKNKNLFYQKIAVLNPNSTFVVSTQNTAKYPAFVKKGDSEMVYVTSDEEAAKYAEFATLDPYVSGALGTVNNYAVSVDYNDEEDVPTGNCYVGRYCSLPVYIIGDAAEGWGMPSSLRQLEYDYKNPDCLVYNTVLKKGEFKMYGDTSGWSSTLSWRPAVSGADPSADNRVVTSFTGDPKWVLAAPAPEGSHIEFKNHELWISLVK